MVKTGVMLIILGIAIVTIMVMSVWNMEMGEESFWMVILGAVAGILCVGSGVVCIVIGLVAMASPNIE